MRVILTRNSVHGIPYTVLLTRSMRDTPRSHKFIIWLLLSIHTIHTIHYSLLIAMLLNYQSHRTSSLLAVSYLLVDTLGTQRWGTEVFLYRCRRCCSLS